VLSAFNKSKVTLRDGEINIAETVNNNSVKMTSAGITIEDANRYLQNEFLPKLSLR
jgi:hypothetical protein